MSARIFAIVRALGLAALIGVVCGATSAAFLVVLDRATSVRLAHEGFVYALPLAALAMGAVLERWGGRARGGTNLVLETVHDHELAPPLPLRMAPMVLFGTVVTHLFGGSAGREGTAVQMGASLADAVAHRFHVDRETRRQLVVAGIAGGFGSVFGTPLAGTVFGVEVLSVGRKNWHDVRAIGPATVAAVVGDFVTRRLGVVHTPYPQLAHVGVTLGVVAKLAAIGIAMGIAAIVFVESSHRLRHFFEAKIVRLPIRMFVGGVGVVVLWKVAGTSDYLGLGVPTIVRAFTDPTLSNFAFAAKLLFTVVTIAAGFLGGEVTPLFFIGATLGSVLARVLGLPIELGAGVGIAAVFGAAANAPLALSIMAIELLGVSVFPHVLWVTAIAYAVSGRRALYTSQRRHRRDVADYLRAVLRFASPPKGPK